MSFESFIGRRYLRVRQKNAFISLITVLATAGVSVGVMVLIAVIAVMSGAEKELEARLLGVTAHVVVLRHGGPFLEYPAVMEKIKTVPGVLTATPYIYTQAVLRSPANISGSVLRGIDPETAGQVTPILGEDNLKRLAQGDASDVSVPEIILGKEVAKSLSVKEGQLISLILPQTGRSMTIQAPSTARFKVAGIFESGLYEFDKGLCFISLKCAQKMLGISDAVSGIEIRVTDVHKAGETAQHIKSWLGFPFWAQDWMQTNRNIFSAIRLQKTVMFIILVLIILVAAFNIASALIMMVMGKTKDIAILKAMGATDWSIKKIFIINGMMIGAAGTFFGVIGGFILCFLLKNYQFIELPTDVYFFSRLPVSLETGDVFVIVISALVICLGATLYPSHRAAKLNPVDALRYGG